jgi:UDP-2,3-diacylglucosamine hydrolase
MDKIFFASDFHLGADGKDSSSIRERTIIRWLDSIKDEADAIYLLGDVFDFWFEYRTVVPKGYIRLQGKLAELTDSGIPIYFFTGNHDMWIFKYFKEELGIETFRHPQVIELQGKRIMIGHGDGLGPGDYGYKIIKKIFANKICQWLFARFHPNFGIALANFWSGRSRYANMNMDRYTSKENEWLYQYCEEILDRDTCDYYIFGHRHIPIYLQLSNAKSAYINLGEWMYSQSYGVMVNGNLELRFFENEHGKIYSE